MSDDFNEQRRKALLAEQDAANAWKRAVLAGIEANAREIALMRADLRAVLAKLAGPAESSRK